MINIGKCNVCGKKILYNKYKMYRGKVLCPECYDTRLERKAAKKAEQRRKAEGVKIVTPTKKAKKVAKKLGVTMPEILKFYGGDDEKQNDTEDSS